VTALTGRTVAADHLASAPDRRRTIIFIWEQFSAYHIDRLEAAAASFCDRYAILGIEFASHSRTYAWAPVASGEGFRRVTLFPGAVSDDVPWPKKLRAAMREIRAARPEAVFLCNQEHPEILAMEFLLRLLGIPSYAMLDAKFDDSPRRVLKEAIKRPILALYRGGLVAGTRSIQYYRFLGLADGWARTAYDTVSVARVRRQAGAPQAPDGLPHAWRDFVVVARFVPKKNLALALHAFARFQELPASGERRRRLVLCGSGPLESELRALAAALGIVESVEFTGFLGPEEVAKKLAGGLALLLPSVEEQWGLVVNEAVALGLPILCSDNVGARDTLVRSGLNGFVFEPGNDEGLAALMHLVSEDEALWRRLALGSQRLAPLGDVEHFVRGVSELLNIPRALHGVTAGRREFRR
jgi:hypothetical protein